MLPRPERLTTSEFAAAFERGRVLRHPLLQVRVHRREAGASARAAFVVPKKLGKATVRNRTRRRLRERYRLHPLRHDARLSRCDLIFMATADAIGAATEELDGAVSQLLRRAAGSVGQGTARQQDQRDATARGATQDEQPMGGTAVS